MDDCLVNIRDVELALIEKGQSSKRYKLGETWELNGEEIREALATVNPAPAMTGWICPKCGRSLSPFAQVCPCSIKWEVIC